MLRANITLVCATHLRFSVMENSKSKKPFYRTLSSTMSAIKAECQSGGAKEILEKYSPVWEESLQHEMHVNYNK